MQRTSLREVLTETGVDDPSGRWGRTPGLEGDMRAKMLEIPDSAPPPPPMPGHRSPSDRCSAEPKGGTGTSPHGHCLGSRA